MCNCVFDAIMNYCIDQLCDYREREKERVREGERLNIVPEGRLQFLKHRRKKKFVDLSAHRINSISFMDETISVSLFKNMYFFIFEFCKKKKKKNLFHYFLFCKCERSKML